MNDGHPDAAPRRGLGRRGGRLALWLVVAAGVAGFTRDWIHVPRADELIRARGSFWEAVDARGAILSTARGLGGVTLQPGDVLRFHDLPADLAWESLTFEAQKLAQSAVLQVTLPGRGADSLVLALVADEPFGVFLAREPAGGEPTILQRAQLPDVLKSMFRPFRVRLVRDGAQAEVWVNGQRALVLADDQLGAGLPSIGTRDGQCGVRRLNVVGHGEQRDAMGQPSAVRLQADLTVLPTGTPWSGIFTGLAMAVGAIVAAGLYLRALCLGHPAVRELAGAAAAWAAPVALCFAVTLVADLPSVGTLAAFACPLGFALALFALRGKVRAPAAGPARVGLASLLIAAALVAGAFAVLRSHAASERAEKSAAERAADRDADAAADVAADTAADGPAPGAGHPTRLAASGLSAPGPTRLDAGNAFIVPGEQRDVEVSASVVLDPDSLLEVRLRADPPPNCRGMALWVPSDPRLRCSFVLETARECTPCSTSSEGVQAGRPIEVRVRAQGGRLEADVGGAHLQASDLELPNAGILLLAARGAATVSDLRVTALPGAAANAASTAGASAATRDALFAVGVLLALVLAFGGGLGWLAALALPRALELTAFALVPLVLGVITLTGNEEDTLQLVARAAWVTAVVLMLPALVHARTIPGARLLLVLVLACVAAPVAVVAVASDGRGPAALMPGSFDYASRAVERLDDDLVYLRHPLLRALNDYLGGHRFRGREFALAKPAGTQRVIALGGSSTWGFGLPEAEHKEYPALIESLLNEGTAQSSAPHVDVLNAAYRGATGVRLFRLLRDGLLSFQPDVVTLSLTYNDSFALTRFDEEAELAAICAPGFRRGWLDDLATPWRLDRARQTLNRLLVELRRWPGPTAELWSRLGHGAGENPPQRFEAMLRRFADLARERGFRLVFIKEPWGGDHRLIWREEFGAAFDRVGSEYGIAVVDPAPALQAAGGRELFQDEIHPRAAGHAIIARIVAPFVRDALGK